MCRFAAHSFIAVVFGIAWCVLAPQLSAADPPPADAKGNPFAAGPSVAAAKGNPFDADPPAAAVDDDPLGDAPAAAATPLDRAPAARSQKAPTSSSEARIRQALERPTVCDFTQTPLQDAIDYLREFHDIEIQLDTRALEDAGIGSDTPVTRQLKGISLAEALRMLLNDFDATYVVRDSVLLITTQDAAEKMVDLRVYEIGELVDSETDANELAEVLRTLFGSGPVIRALTNDHAVADTRTIATIRRTGEACFNVLPYRNLLIVQATQYDHDALAQLLSEIKSKAKKDK